jgi:hypothetical protein
MSFVAEFRKKPVVIDAFRPFIDQTPGWFQAAMDAGKIFYRPGPDEHFSITTLEGVMRAIEGDWVIRGVAGEVYPCKADIFAKTYEPVVPTQQLQNAGD